MNQKILRTNKFKRSRVVALSLGIAAASLPFGMHSARAATATWVGNNSALWSDTTGNWTGGADVGGRPASGDALVFGAAGTAGPSLIDDLMTVLTYNVAGITFSGPSAFTINPNTVGTNGFTLTAGITNSSGVTQTINDLVGLSNVVHTVTLTTATDRVVLGGDVSVAGTASNLTTVGLGTLVLSGNNNFGGGSITLGTGTTLQLQANTANTTAGVSSASNTGAGRLTLVTNSASGNATTVQLRSDSAVSFNPNSAIFQGSTGTSTQLTFDVNNLTGSGSNNVISFASGGLTFNSGGNGAAATINVTGGNGYSLSLGMITDTTGASGSKTIRITPTTANVTVGGFTSTVTNGNRTLALDGTSSGNSMGAVLRDPIAGADNTIVTKSNTGTWTLTGTNNYVGATNVSGGTLIVTGTGSTNTGVYNLTGTGILRGTNFSAFGDNTNINLGGTSTLQLRGDTSGTFGRTTGGAAYTTSITATGTTINADQATVAGTNQTFTLGALTVTSTAATVNTTFTGANNTSLILGAITDTTATSGTVQFTNNITGGGSLTVGGFTGTRTGTPTLTFSGTGNTTVNGAISQAATGVQALTYNGAGILTLSGANTYTGTTTVSSGTLLVNGTNTGAGSVVVGAAGGIGGGGAISNTVGTSGFTTAAGSRITPGGTGTVGMLTLTYTGTATVVDLSASSNGSGSYTFDLATIAASDRLVVNQGASFNLGNVNAADFTFNRLAGFGAGTYKLVDSDNTITMSGLNTSTFSLGGGYNGALSYDATNFDILLTVTAVVPEPGTWGMLFAGAGIWLSFYMKRRLQRA